MEFEALVVQVLGTWRRHDEILLCLLDRVPARGFAALPAGSRGRDVARQFAHLNRVRLGWLLFHQTGKRPMLPRLDKGRPPARAALRKALSDSGKQVEGFLEQALRGDIRPRFFGRQAVRWMGYLVAHESHHRGQIVLALKQSGMRLPEAVTVQGLWGKWIMGK